MRDVSVVVGGISQGGPYSSALNTQGDIDTQGASTVLVENFSPFPFQIGQEYVAPVTKRTFAIDNYPSLKWKIGVSLAQVNVSNPRLVRIILDPIPPVADDGPVYPRPIPITVVNQAPGVGNVYDALLLLGAQTSVDLTQIRDQAIVAMMVQGTGLDTFITSIVADNGPTTILGQMLPYNIYKQTSDFIGKDWSFYTEMPGNEKFTINLNAGSTKGTIVTTLWIGYHL